MAGQQKANLYQKTPGGVWYTRFKIEGRDFRFSTGQRDRRKAESESRKIRVETERRVRKRGKPESLVELAGRDITEAKGRGLNAHYVRAIESRWGKVLAGFGADTLITDVTEDDLRSYEGRRRQDGVRGQTISRELRYMKRIMHRAQRRGWIDEIPEFPKVRRNPPDPKLSGKFWDPELVREFLSRLKEVARDECMFAAATGLRWKEIKRVEAGWVEPAPKGSPVPYMLRLPESGTKTKTKREVGLSAAAFGVIQRRIATNGGAVKVFCQKDYKKHRARVCRDMGLPHNITLRDLRHTHATLALQQTQDPKAVMAALGHHDLNMTNRYLSSPLNRTLGTAAAVSGLLESGETGDTPGDTGD